MAKKLRSLSTSGKVVYSDSAAEADGGGGVRITFIPDNSIFLNNTSISLKFITV
jgi:hypothetical protein